MTTLKPGDLAFYDAFLCGLVPCKVAGYKDGAITIKLTADRQAHKRGEVLNVHSNDVIPRHHVHVRNGKYCVSGTWNFAGLAEEHQPQWSNNPPY